VSGRTKSDRQTPAGGISGAGGVRRWRWSGVGSIISEPVRCRKEQWYLVRAVPSATAATGSAGLQLHFLNGDGAPQTRCVATAPVAGNGNAEHVAWFKTPDGATHLRVEVPVEAAGRSFASIVLHAVSERDPKCHPLANVPRWSSVRPPQPLERIVLPESLAGLAAEFEGAEVKVVKRPASRARFGALALGAACVVPEDWVRALSLTLGELERLSEASWLVVDLATLGRLLGAAGLTGVGAQVQTSEHGLMSARVEFADVATRGFGLQDVIPYGWRTSKGEFAVRVLPAKRAWKRYADANGFAPLLISETPWEDRCHDVVCASRPESSGELLATDLPWIVAEAFGPPIAPRLSRRLLRAHLGCPVDDWAQYWTRWDEARIVVRDVSDLARRYEPCRTQRWQSPEPGVVQLGLRVGPRDARRCLVVRTGRIDQKSRHAGLPPEPMMVFCKALARELREQTAWARRCMRDAALVWQFDTAEGTRYATHFDAAEPLTRARELHLSLEDDRVMAAAPGGTWTVVSTHGDGGIFGDGAFEVSEDLTRCLRRWIERAARDA